MTTKGCNLFVNSSPSWTMSPYPLAACAQDPRFMGFCLPGGGGGVGVLPFMGYIGMCHCEGYGFQEVYSRMWYINQGILV